MTRAVRKYTDEGLLVKVINWEGPYHYRIIITPQSDNVVINCLDLDLVNRATIPLFSDWVIRAKAYDFFIQQFLSEEQLHVDKDK